MMIDRPKVSKQRRQDVPAEHAVEQANLQPVSHDEQHGNGEQRAREAAESEPLSDGEDQEGGADDDIAMREVDEPHDPEHQRQAGREQRVEPAQQCTLQDDIDYGAHAGAAPK